MGRVWVNVIGRDPEAHEEWTIWNGFTDAPEVQVILRPGGRGDRK